MKRWLYPVLIVFLLSCSVMVLADEEYVLELNTLNTIDYVEGQTITISTRAMYGADSLSDVSCGVLAVDEVGNIALSYSSLIFNDVDSIYEYAWVPTPAPESFWQSIYHSFFPTSGTYVAVINCTGGLLGVNLTDNVVIRVVPQ